MRMRTPPPADGSHLLCVEGQVTALRLHVCASFRARLVGWGRGPGDAPHTAAASAMSGVWLQPCSAVHTLWLRRPIDLAFIDAGGRIQRTCAAVPPRRGRISRGAAAVLELAPGALLTWGLAPGVRVAVLPAR
jgi:hypothetical protein